MWESITSPNQASPTELPLSTLKPLLVQPCRRAAPRSVLRSVLQPQLHKAEQCRLGISQELFHKRILKNLCAAPAKEQCAAILLGDGMRKRNLGGGSETHKPGWIMARFEARLGRAWSNLG